MEARGRYYELFMRQLGAVELVSFSDPSTYGSPEVLSRCRLLIPQRVAKL